MGNASPPPMQLPVLSPPSLFSSPYRLISSDFLLPPPPCHLFSSATHHLSCSSFFLHSSLSDGHHLQKANRKKQQSLGLGVGGGSSYKMAAKVRMDISMSGDCCFFFWQTLLDLSASIHGFSEKQLKTTGLTGSKDYCRRKVNSFVSAVLWLSFSVFLWDKTLYLSRLHDFISWFFFMTTFSFSFLLYSNLKNVMLFI